MKRFLTIVIVTTLACLVFAQVNVVVKGGRIVTPSGGSSVVVRRIPWTPSLIDTVVWYDASDSSTITLNPFATNQVQQWSDKSGNGNDLTQTVAARQLLYGSRFLNEKNVLESSGNVPSTSMNIDVPFNDTNPATFIWVSEYDDNSANTIFSDDSGTKYWGQWTSTRFGRRYPTAASTDAQPIGGWTAAEGAGIGHLSRDVSNNWFVSENGNDLRSAGPVDSTRTRIFYIPYGGSSTYGLDGTLAEVIVFRGNDVDERQKVEGYLAWKWGLEDNLPIGHRYKDAPPYKDD